MAREIGLVAPVLPGAEEDHLNAGLAAFPVQREHVGFGETCGIDPLARMNLAHGADAVAQLRGGLEIHGFRGVLHVLRELVLDQAALAGEKALCLIHQRRIASAADPPPARRAPSLYLMQDTC